MKRILQLVVVAMLPVLMGQHPANSFYSFGGQESCGSWLTDPTYADDSLWIEGFVSGLNSASSLWVGEHTDGPGIVGEVKLMCTNNPSMNVIEATLRVYKAMRASGR